jgi:hypothetical protein
MACSEGEEPSVRTQSLLKGAFESNGIEAGECRFRFLLYLERHVPFHIMSSLAYSAAPRVAFACDAA